MKPAPPRIALPWIKLPLIALLGILLTLPATPLAHAEDDDRGKIMDLSFEDTPIQEVISAIARYSGKNIIVGPNVKGRVTIDLEMVDAMTALKTLATSHGLTVGKEAHGILRVQKGRPATGTASGGRFEVPPPAPVLMRVYDVRDLAAKDKRLGKLLKKLDGADARVIRDRGNLIVYGRPKVHALLATGLDRIRSERGKDVLVVLDDEVIESELMEDDANADEEIEREVIEEGGRRKGRTRARSVKRDMKHADGVRLRAHLAEGERKIEAGQRRIENLQRALAHLKAAKAPEEAERVAKQLAVAKAEHDRARAWMAQAEADAAAARKHAGTPRRPTGARGTSLESLHADVRALRGEVRQLTELVKKLLDMQAGSSRRRAR